MKEESIFDYKSCFEAGLDGMLLTAPDGAILDANPKACRILGRTCEEVIAAQCDGIFDTSDPRLRAALEEQRTTGRFEGELSLLHPDGTPFPAEVSMVAYRTGADGVAFREAPEYKREEELRKSEIQYRALVESGPDLMLIVNADNVVCYANPAAEKVLGYRSEELIGTSISDLLHPNDFKRAASTFGEDVSASGSTITQEFRYQHKDGSWCYLETTLNNLIEVPYVRAILGHTRDITERRRLEQALCESEERFHALVQHSSDVITVIDGEGTIRYVSPAIERILGHRPEELKGNSVFDYVSPNDIKEAQNIFSRLWSQPGVHSPFEFKAQHKDGSWRHFEFIVNNLLNDPTVRGVVINQRDVTERKRTEEILRESEERFRATFDQAPVGIAHVGPDGRYLRVNQKLCDIVGYTREELLGRAFQDLVHHDDLTNDLQCHRQLLAGEIDTCSIEKRSIRQDYSQVWVIQNISLVRGRTGDPSYFIYIIDETTDRKKAQALTQSLTSREVEVLKLLAQGGTNREIAEKMRLSVGTVKLNVHRIISKLEVSDRTQAAVRAVELGLVNEW